MMSKIKGLLAALLISINVSCDPATATVASGGISGSGISWGAIVAFGSVYVNGVHYDTSKIKDVQIDGVNADESKLKVGMVVRVYGDIDANDPTQGVATGIEYESDVKGPLANIDATNGQFDILTKTVHVLDSTIYENELGITFNGLSDLNDPSKNYYAEVSGFSNGDGQLYATLINIKKYWVDGGEIELKGLVNTIASPTLTIGNLQIDYRNASVELESASAFSSGMYIKVKGVYSAGVVEAKEIREVEDGIVGSEGEESEIEGVVTSALLNEQFTLNSQTIRITGDTELGDGSVDGIIVGAALEVSGYFDANGILIAKQIELESSADGSLEGSIDSLDIESKTFVLTVDLAPYNIVTNNSTIFKDDREFGVLEEQIDFSGLCAGDEVKVDYYIDTIGQYVAKKVVVTAGGSCQIP